jgi:phage shock protein PspC (stress-responsive transcriptional regulator)
VTIIFNVLELVGYIIAAIINPGIHSAMSENYNK